MAKLKQNGLKTAVVVVLLTAVLGVSGFMLNRVNDHETRITVVEKVMGRVDKNVEKLLERRR